MRAGTSSEPGLETSNAEIDPPEDRGKPPTVGKRTTKAPTVSAGAPARMEAPDQFPETGLDGFEAGVSLRRRQLPFHGYPVRDDEIAPAEAEPASGVRKQWLPR